MKELLEYSPLLIALGSIISFFVITRSNTITNKNELETIKKALGLFEDRLLKKDKRISNLEAEKIKFGEALERTYMTSAKAYESFVEKIAYEKELIRIEKNIETTVKNVEQNSEKTLKFLQDLLTKSNYDRRSDK